MLITIADVSLKHIDISLKPVFRRNESSKQNKVWTFTDFFLAVWYLKKYDKSDDKVSLIVEYVRDTPIIWVCKAAY